MDQLFLTLRSPYARIVRIIADVKHIPLVLTEVSLQERSAELLAVSSFGGIPALKTKIGNFSDSRSIVRYLDACSPDPKIYAADPLELARQEDRICMAYGIADRAVLMMKENLQPESQRKPALIAKLQQEIDRALALLATQVNAIQSFPMLDAVTLACALGYLEFRLPSLDWKGKFPTLSAWFEAIQKQDAFRETMPKQ